jgi:hypothetical protein
MAILKFIVFLSAFLLFVSEPLIGRLLLPFWGGAVYIWLICIMFFQAMLLLGYSYAHFLGRRIGLWHLLFLIVPLINLPFSIGKEPNLQTPVLSLLVLLLIRFALPFAMLSTTVVVGQSWLTQSYLRQHYEPYPLYAASNAGSLVGLFGYAFIIEPLIGVKTQSVIWAACYMGFVILMGVTRFLLVHGRRIDLNALDKRAAAISERVPALSNYVSWFLLSSLPAALLLAVTNFICMEIGSFPMIWIVPLALYLGSFVVTFRTGDNVVLRLLSVFWPETLLLASAFYFVRPDTLGAMIGCLFVFFIICMQAHRKLYETRPPERWLTNFYLTTAIGGFLGGVSVSLIAPLLFKGYLEYFILLLILGVTFGWLGAEPFMKFWRRVSFVIASGRIAFIGILLGLSVIGAWRLFHERVIYRHRNFYGTYQVVDALSFDKKLGGIRKLVHGNTLHGAQLLHPSMRMLPTAYYYRGGGFSDVFETTPGARRVAIIGLGAGILSVYMGEKDALTFFEIDPDNYEIAKRWFTFLGHCKGKVKVVIGDGRLSMRDFIEDGSKFDLITLDAFTGDGIPIHLLTREAFEIYLSRLAEDGIILLHISNRYYDLRPVVKSTVGTLKLFGAANRIVEKETLEKYQNPANWVAVARNRTRLQVLIDRGWVVMGEGDGLSKVKPWTDDHMSIVVPLIEMMKRNFSKFAQGRREDVLDRTPKFLSP